MRGGRERGTDERNLRSKSMRSCASRPMPSCSHPCSSPRRASSTASLTCFMSCVYSCSYACVRVCHTHMCCLKSDRFVKRLAARAAKRGQQSVRHAALREAQTWLPRGGEGGSRKEAAGTRHVGPTRHVGHTRHVGPTWTAASGLVVTDGLPARLRNLLRSSSVTPSASHTAHTYTSGTQAAMSNEAGKERDGWQAETYP